MKLVSVMVHLISLLCLVSAAAEETGGLETRLYTLDGSERLVSSWSLNPQGFLIDFQTIAWDKVDELRFTQQNDLADVETQRFVVLVDGSVIPARSVTVLEKKPEYLQIESVIGSLAIPWSQVKAWGDIQPHSVQARNDDLLVLAGGRQVSGKLLEVRHDVFLLQSPIDPDQPLPIPAESVQAVYLNNIQSDIEQEALLGSLSNEFAPLHLALTSPLRLQLIPHLELVEDIPWKSLIVHNGNKVYLSDIEPVSRREEGAFDVVWPAARDKNIDGSPLFLDGRYYRKGLVLHSFAEFSWDINGEFRRLQGRVGISDSLKNEGDCIVKISLDGRIVWEKRIRGSEQSYALSLDCDAAQKLEILVDYGERFDIGDHVAFAGIALIK